MSNSSTPESSSATNESAKTQAADPSTGQERLPREGLSQELFEALDDMADVVVALQESPEHAEKAQQLDQAGKKIIDALVHEFSLRSAQVEVLLRETDHIDEAWGDYVEKIARRNDHLDRNGAIA